VTERSPAGGEPINCHKCKHYYVTWDTQVPCGCKAAGFKSPRMPSADVLAASGKNCLLFEPKRK